MSRPETRHGNGLLVAVADLPTHIGQQQGYDLTPYKGKQVQLYTYEITNYTGYDQGIVADLLVSNGRVIGADLCNTSAKDGFMLGLEKRK